MAEGGARWSIFEISSRNEWKLPGAVQSSSHNPVKSVGRMGFDRGEKPTNNVVLTSLYSIDRGLSRTMLEDDSQPRKVFVKLHQCWQERLFSRLIAVAC